VVLSVIYVLVQRVLALAMLRFRTDRSKDLEIVVLRNELAILRRQVTPGRDWGCQPEGAGEHLDAVPPGISEGG